MIDKPLLVGEEALSNEIPAENFENQCNADQHAEDRYLRRKPSDLFQAGG
jgi:hypothetical protein